MRLLPRSSPVPLHRRWIADIIHFGRKAHVVGADLTINVAPVATARAARQPPASWVSIWIRALGIAARKRPELRTAYLPLPWPRLYIHPVSVTSIAVEREWRGTPAVFFQTIVNAEARSLKEIDQNAFGPLKHVPVESVGAFRRMIRIARLPLLVRRLLWSVAIYGSGRLRSKYLGCVAVNSLALLRFRITQNVTPVSFMVYFGRVEPDGDMTVQLFWDHRVMDALEVERMMREIEAILNTEIVAELEAP